jgi:hypothetical protein
MSRNGSPTPISEYTLPMALSDADAYYQAGTVASALIGLSKTVANADRNADQAKSDAGPNPGAVSGAKEQAAPHSNGTTSPKRDAVIIRTQFRRDLPGDTLFKFVFPEGVAGGPNRTNAAKVTTIMREMGITDSLATFVRSDKYVTQRAEVARRLGLSQ